MKHFHYEKDQVVMVGDQLMTDIRAAHRAGIRSILVKPLVQHDSIKTQINRARERHVMRKITEKYGPITYKKRNLTMEEILCIGCGATIQTTDKTGLGFTASVSTRKRFGNWWSLLPTLFPSSSLQWNHRCPVDGWWFPKTLAPR